MRPDVLHRRMEVEHRRNTGYRSDVFRDGERRDDDIIRFIPFDFPGKDSHQTRIEEHQITVVEQPRKERDLVGAASKEKIIYPYRQSRDYPEVMMLCLESAAIGKNGEYGRMFHILLFVDEIPEHGKRSSWLDPAMYKSNFHCFLIK